VGRLPSSPRRYVRITLGWEALVAGVK
jgi:hypothetical protein